MQNIFAWYKHIVALVALLLWSIQAYSLSVTINNTGQHSHHNATTNTSLPKSIAYAMQKTGTKQHNVSFVVAPIHSTKKQPIALYNANTKRLPASILKLYTTFTALDVLGKDFAWKTKVYHTGTINNGVLSGNLYIKGSGDPKFVKEHIISLLQKIQAQGITAINGDIILDASIFSTSKHNPNTFDGKSLKPYNAGANGLLVNFSSFILKFYPQPKQGIAIIEPEPITAGIHIPKTIKLTNKTSCKNWKQKVKTQFSAYHISFNGAYPRSCGEKYLALAHNKPNVFAKAVIKGNWLALGGTLTGKVSFGLVPNTAYKNKLAMHASPTLSSIIHDINHFSNNVMTEQVFLSLPAFAPKGTTNNKAGITYTQAQTFYTNWWQKTFNAKLPVPFIQKASGLCYQCYVKPVNMLTFLQHASTHPQFATFKNSLSIVGKTGTAKGTKWRNKNNSAIGRGFIKTGTLSNVTSVAGYVHSLSGQWYAVVAIVNKPNAATAKPVLDAVLHWTAQQ